MTRLGLTSSIALVALSCARSPVGAPPEVSAPPATSASEASSATAPPMDGSIEGAAAATVALLEKCDASARDRFLSYDEMFAITEETPDAATYDQMLSATVARRCKELAGAAHRVKVLKRDTAHAATDPGKLKRDVDVALVRVVADPPNGKPDPEGFVFFETGGAWKLSVMR